MNETDSLYSTVHVPAEDDLPLEPLAPDPRHPRFRLDSKEARHDVVHGPAALSANPIQATRSVEDCKYQ